MKIFSDQLYRIRKKRDTTLLGGKLHGEKQQKRFNKKPNITIIGNYYIIYHGNWIIQPDSHTQESILADIYIFQEMNWSIREEMNVNSNKKIFNLKKLNIFTQLKFKLYTTLYESSKINCISLLLFSFWGIMDGYYVTYLL